MQQAIVKGAQPGTQAEARPSAPDAPQAQPGYLLPGKAVFEETPGRLLSLRAGEEHYPRVELFRSFPHSDSARFISVRTPEPDGKEIGIIRDVHAFDEKTAELLERHLDVRYFAPNITKINGVREEFGYTFWNVETDCGGCRFVVRRNGKDIRALQNGKVVIADVDGNRFAIPDVKQLAEKELKQIELYL